MRRSSRRKYDMDNRPALSEDELLNYLRTNNFRSRLQLRRGRKPGDPKDNDYVRQFGCWSNAMTRAFGNESFLKCDFNDRNYHIKCVIEFGLWNSYRYRDIRKRNQDVIPAFHTIEKVWGRYSKLRNAAQDVCVRRIGEKYRQLRARLGRRVLPEDCKEAGIIPDVAIKFFGGKWEYDEYIERLNTEYERDARSAGKVSRTQGSQAEGTQGATTVPDAQKLCLQL